MNARYAFVAVFAFALACGKDTETTHREPEYAPKATCQVTGSCRLCTQTADCADGEICTTFPIGGRQYSGCVAEHGCSAPQILEQAAAKCGTANPIGPEPTGSAPAGSAAGSAGEAAGAPAGAGSAAPKK